MAGKNKTARCMPDDFTVNGWNRANNYGLRKEDFADAREYTKVRYKRSQVCFHAYQQTDAYKKSMALRSSQAWEERAAKAKRESDTMEVLLLEKITQREEGFTTAELVSNCINMIARELTKRGVRDLESLDLRDLVLISNTLIGLTKSAAAVKKETGFKPNVQVNNISVNNSSKTGGVVGDLRDVIDLRKGK